MANEKVPANIAPQMNDGEDKAIVGKKYSNGAQHFYEVDAEGKEKHISGDDVLEAYGYTSRSGHDTSNIDERIAARNSELVSILDAHRDIIQNARNYITLELAPIDGSGTSILKKSFYSEHNKTTQEQTKFITATAERLAKEKFGLRLKSAGDAGWEEDEELLDKIIELLHMSDERFEGLEKHDEPPLVVPPADTADTPSVDPVDAPRTDTLEDEGEWLNFHEKVTVWKERKARIEAISLYLENQINRIAEHHQASEEAEKTAAEHAFMEVFAELASLYGWSEVEKEAKLQEFIEVYNTMVNPDVPPPRSDIDEKNAKKAALLTEISNKKTELETARKTLAELKVAASSKLYVRKELREKLEAAHKAWQDLHAQAGALSMELTLVDEEDMSAEDLKAIAKTLSKEQQQELKEAQSLASENGPTGSRIKKIFHWYAKKYNDGGRIKKALLLAPGGIVAGVGVGTVLGAIGGGIFAAAVARGTLRSALTAKLQALKEKGTTEADFDSLDLLEIDFDEIDRKAAAEMLAARAAGLGKWASEKEVSDSLSNNRKGMTRAVAIGSIVGAASGIAANWVMDQHPAKGSGAYEKTTGKRLIFDTPKQATKLTGLNSNYAIPSGMMPQAPSAPSTEALAGLRIFDIKGQYPWDRAVKFTGSSSQARHWLEEAVRKTPGARWDYNTGASTDDIIQVINPETGTLTTDTDIVWRELSKSMIRALGEN